MNNARPLLDLLRFGNSLFLANSMLFALQMPLDFAWPNGVLAFSAHYNAPLRQMVEMFHSYVLSQPPYMAWNDRSDACCGY
jgi:hypothetical protein